MKKTIMIRMAILTLVSALFLGGCSRYASSFSALMLVTTNSSQKASMSFSGFEGTKVFELKNKSADGAELAYHAELTGGSATVYYDSDGTKTEWFTLNAGETADSSLYIPDQGKISIIVETDGRCEEGKFEFYLK